MKTVTEITNEVEDQDWYATYNSLKKWAEELIDACVYALSPDDDGNSEVTQELKDQL